MLLYCILILLELEFVLSITVPSIGCQREISNDEFDSCIMSLNQGSMHSQAAIDMTTNKDAIVPGIWKPETWEYGFDKPNGFHAWPGMCGHGLRQSPINIPLATVEKDYKSPDLLFRDYNVPIKSKEMSIKNTGRTAKFKIKNEASPGFTLSDMEKGSSSQFMLANGHFHWGGDEYSGAEHSINTKTFPLEMHLVHFNEKLGSNLEEAIVANKSNSLSVLAIMFEPAIRPNLMLQPFLKTLKLIRNQGDKVEVLFDGEDFSLTKFLPQDTKEFFQYYGSLTTPDCNEIVHWIIFKNPVPISRDQLQLFRLLTFESSTGKTFLVDNNRPIQDLNGRSVF